MLYLREAGTHFFPLPKRFGEIKWDENWMSFIVCNGFIVYGNMVAIGDLH